MAAIFDAYWSAIYLEHWETYFNFAKGTYSIRQGPLFRLGQTSRNQRNRMSCQFRILEKRKSVLSCWGQPEVNPAFRKKFCVKNNQKMTQNRKKGNKQQKEPVRRSRWLKETNSRISKILEKVLLMPGYENVAIKRVEAHCSSWTLSGNTAWHNHSFLKKSSNSLPSPVPTLGSSPLSLESSYASRHVLTLDTAVGLELTPSDGATSSVHHSIM